MLADLEFLNRLRSVLVRIDVVLVRAAIAVMGSFVVWAVYRARTEKTPSSPFRKTGLVWFTALVPFMFVALLGQLVESRMKLLAQRRLRDHLAEQRGPHVVRVGGVPAKYPRELCEALRHVRSIAAHRSGRTEAYLVSIESSLGEKVVLELYRDSGRRDEYWVYWPIIKDYREFEMGRIRGLDREWLRGDPEAAEQ